MNANQLPITTLTLTPDQVKENFPNSLFSKANVEVVNQANFRGLKVRVSVLEAVWGRTVIGMEVI